MAIKVLWTDTAEQQLLEIFNYYTETVSINVAKKIVDEIVDETIYLEKHPNAGQEEILLKKRKFSYRYIVKGNYKIIYWIEGEVVNIATVFDCRQNPKKLKRKIK